jgi:methyl-accepting chemotaxis protein
MKGLDVEREIKVNRETNSTYQIWVERMQIIFSSMIGVKPYYMQLRYINEKGNQLLRLDSDGTNIKNIPDCQLQNQAHRG